MTRLTTRLIVYTVFILWSTGAYAQQPQPLQDVYSIDMKVNYVRTWEAAAPETDPGTLVTRPLRAVKQTTQYADGLGRPLQTVIKQGSLTSTNGNNPVDFVSAVKYDQLGREVYKYLPFAANNTSGLNSTNDGLFKLDPYQQQAAFAATQYQGERFYYGETRYEPSPLNRMTESFAPGDSWAGTYQQPDENDRRSVKAKYFFNTTTDEVRSWTITDVANDFGVVGTNGIYAADELYKNITVDEQGRQVIEFKDKEGLVILKKVQLTALADDGSGSAHANWLCTYYIYDDANLLRAVIQPQGVELLMQNGWNITSLNGDILKEQCFRYEYDQRDRMTMKQVPGAEALQMVYDVRDRLVFTQDANLKKNNQWLTTRYDGLNRPVMTGLTIYNGTAATLQALVTAQTGADVNNPMPSNASFTLLTQTGYDNYDGIPAGFSTTDLVHGYEPFLDAAASDFPDPVVQAAPLTGLITWTKAKVLGEDKYITSCNLYDEKGRVIQVQTMNYTGATDIVTNQYSFSGQLLRSHVKHQKSGGDGQHYDLATKYSYDDLGRITAVEKRLNNDGWKVVGAMTYNALGQPITKKLAPAYNNNAGIETLTYEYNIRGWLLGANRVYATNTANNTHYFGFDLGYDKQHISSLGTYTAAQYNGNIAGTVWKSKGDGQVRKYDFTYDNVNRLTGADFTQYNSGFNTSAGIDFSVSDLTYDANGNILTQSQKGLKVSGSDYIDRLHYTYLPNSNKLQNVIDDKNDPQTRLGDFRASQTYMDALGGTKAATVSDYVYDDNGNLTGDLNKDITAIEYNHLNLPQTITIKNKGSIDYTYDANGNKLKKTVHETGKPDKTTLYLFGTYENDVLQFLPQEEGRIRPVRDGNGNITSFTWDYFLKDHLGNIRMVLTEENKTNIYQTGMEDANRSFEVALFGDKVNATATNKPGGFDTDDNNKKVSVVNGTDPETRVGPGVILKVMAGDKIKARASAWYQPTGMDNGTDPGVTSILTNLLGQLVPGIAGAAKGAMSEQVTGGALQPGMENFLRTQSPTDGAPQAYLNWVLLDEEQYKMAAGGATPVPLIDGTKEKQLLEANGGNEIEMPKNGYLYVFVSNESKGNVYFDDLRVEHIRGPLTEETHYYPFGLTMAGISSKAANSQSNRFKFNEATELESKEFSDESGLELYATEFRRYDPQIGRFIQMDDWAELAERWSPYVFANNNPVLLNDPLGLVTDTTTLETVYVSPSGAGALSPVCFTCMANPNPSAATGPIAWYVLTRERFISGSNDKVDLYQFLELTHEMEFDNPEYQMEHTVVLKRKWYEIWESDGYLGKNIYGRDVYSNYLMGTPPAVSFARVASGRSLFKIFRGSWFKKLPPLPSIDATGKVHGLLPKIRDLRKYSPEELKIFLQELKASVAERIRKTVELGRDQSHGERQGAEQQIIKAIEKILEDIR